jgi:hypothetical protein
MISKTGENLQRQETVTPIETMLLSVRTVHACDEFNPLIFHRKKE